MPNHSGETKVIAFLDKAVVKITGVTIKGLRPFVLEERLAEVLDRPVRVIGVAGDSIEIDIYELSSEQIIRNKDGIIKTVATTPGMTAQEVVDIVEAEKAATVPLDQLKNGIRCSCPKEGWVIKSRK